jgi:RNA ligase
MEEHPNLKGQKLLSRTDFRESVFARDNHKCVFCKAPAQDAHHIIERRLWPDGGYYLNNGISVCEPCHLKCESTDISVEQAREAANITKIIIPPHLYDDLVIDKWGNTILPNGSRLKGELFFDESVQKIIKDKLVLFLDYVKYPRTMHLPWSEGVGEDDRTLKNIEHFVGKEVVVTEKFDGENTSIYPDYIHARSLDGRNHPSRNWVKNFASSFQFAMPKGWRICGENLYAKHSIHYSNLNSYFLGFSIWDETNRCLSWDETIEWFQLLDIEPVRVLWRGTFDEELIRRLYTPENRDQEEGYVVRVAESFSYGQFQNSVAKFVRKNHVHTHGHWMREIITVNGIKKNK